MPKGRSPFYLTIFVSFEKAAQTEEPAVRTDRLEQASTLVNTTEIIPIDQVPALITKLRTLVPGLRGADARMLRSVISRLHSYHRRDSV